MTAHEQRRSLIFMLSCINFDEVALLSKTPDLVLLAKAHSWPEASGVTEGIRWNMATGRSALPGGNRIFSGSYEFRSRVGNE